jgi:hypothetical protein
LTPTGRQATLALKLVTRHGRATPLIWLSMHKDGQRDARSAYEDVGLRRLAEVPPDAPGQKPRHGSERNYLWRPTLPSRCLSAMCPMPTNSSRVL